MSDSNEKVSLKPFNEVWKNIPNIKPFDEPFKARAWALNIIQESEKRIKKEKIEQRKSREDIEEIIKKAFQIISKIYSCLWEILTKPVDSSNEIENAKNWGKEIIRKVEENS